MRKQLQILVLLLLCSYSQLDAQVPDNNYGRLYRLCKTWGYVKYHHPNKCNINWNELLLSRVDSVYNASSNTQFNDILYNMCLAAGITTAPTSPVLIMSDSAKNYHIDWFNDPLLSLNVRNYLDSVHAHAIVDTFCSMLTYNDYSNPNYYSLIDFRHDSINNVAGFSYTNLKHRALVYFYYWNIINYFAPQIDIADTHWDSTLYQLMPDIIQATNDSAFHLALAKVVSRIDDSHGSFSSQYQQAYLSDMPLSQPYRTCYIKLARIENKHVVVNSGVSNIHRGDIILKINGKDLDSLFTVQSKYMAASNQITKYRNFYTNMFDGPPGATKTITLIDSANNTIQVTVNTDKTYTQYYNWLDAEDTNPVYQHIDCGGYVHMGKLQPADVADMYDSLKNLPYIIFDIRNYPNGTLWDIKPLLFPNPSVSAHYFMPDISYPGYSYVSDDLDNFGTWSNPTPYQGKVIILVNEETQSQAEYTAQALRTYPNSVIFGSQTAGADGNISYVELPGPIYTFWSSLGWYQANWFNPQRAGVQVDTIVQRSIWGVRHHVDEVLNRAMTCPTGIPEINPTQFMINWNNDFVQVKTDQSKRFDVRICDLLGQEITHLENNNQLCRLAISGYAPGMYIVSVWNNGKRILAKKITKE